MITSSCFSALFLGRAAAIAGAGATTVDPFDEGVGAAALAEEEEEEEVVDAARAKAEMLRRTRKRIPRRRDGDP